MAKSKKPKKTGTKTKKKTLKKKKVEEETVADLVIDEEVPEEEPEPEEKKETHGKILSVNGEDTTPTPPESEQKPEKKKKDTKKEKEDEPEEDEPKKKKKNKKEGQLTIFFKSLNNIGMGKLRMEFIRNLSTMLGAGLTLLEALQTLAMEIKSRSMKKTVQRIAEAVENGSPLWRAMDAQHLFDTYEVSLIRIGEEAGSLAQNMEYLVVQQEKGHSLKQKVKMAMIYPAIVLTLLFIVVVGMGMFVLPNLVQVLYSLNADLPFTTLLLIKVTDQFEQNGAVFVPLVIAFMVFLALLTKYTRFRAVTQAVIFLIPGIGRLAREATIARFGVILGGLLQAGVPLPDALQSLVDATSMVSYEKLYRKLHDHITVGDSFSKSFKELGKKANLLPISVQQLVVTGEKSGQLSNILLKISDIYDQKASETAQKLPTILEPMLLLFIGGLVGGIAFAIITPIYSVVGNVGR